jgi:hypothetical protein
MLVLTPERLHLDRFSKFPNKDVMTLAGVIR